MSEVASQKLGVQKLSIEKRTIRSLTENETDAVAGGSTPLVATVLIVSLASCIVIAFTVANNAE